MKSPVKASELILRFPTVCRKGLVQVACPPNVVHTCRAVLGARPGRLPRGPRTGVICERGGRLSTKKNFLVVPSPREITGRNSSLSLNQRGTFSGI